MKTVSGSLCGFRCSSMGYLEHCLSLMVKPQHSAFLGSGSCTFWPSAWLPWAPLALLLGHCKPRRSHHHPRDPTLTTSLPNSPFLPLESQHCRERAPAADQGRKFKCHHTASILVLFISYSPCKGTGHNLYPCHSLPLEGNEELPKMLTISPLNIHAPPNTSMHTPGPKCQQCHQTLHESGLVHQEGHIISSSAWKSAAPITSSRPDFIFLLLLRCIPCSPTQRGREQAYREAAAKRG